MSADEDGSGRTREPSTHPQAGTPEHSRRRVVSPEQASLNSRPMLTASEYRAAASAICQRANQKLSEEMPQEGLAEPVTFAEEVAREAYESLARLAPPQELANLHSEMLVRTHDLLVGYPTLITAAREGMPEFARVSAEQSDRSQRLGVELEELWRRLGVPECNR